MVEFDGRDDVRWVEEGQVSHRLQMSPPWAGRGQKNTFCDIFYIPFITEASRLISVSLLLLLESRPADADGMPETEWADTRPTEATRGEDSLCELPGRCAWISVYHLFVLGSPLVTGCGQGLMRGVLGEGRLERGLQKLYCGCKNRITRIGSDLRSGGQRKPLDNR